MPQRLGVGDLGINLHPGTADARTGSVNIVSVPNAPLKAATLPRLDGRTAADLLQDGEGRLLPRNQLAGVSFSCAQAVGPRTLDPHS